MESERLEKLIEFLKVIEKMKLISRGIHKSSGDNENDAEHVWHLCMFIYVFSNDLPKELDLLKMLKMALVHDLVEIYAGDTFAYDKNTDVHASKAEKEMLAAKKLFSTLPKDLEEEFMHLFLEFEESTTPEAKFVQSFDKIQPILQNLVNKGISWKAHNITTQEIDEYKGKKMKHNPTIEQLYKRLLQEGIDNKWI